MTKAIYNVGGSSLAGEMDNPSLILTNKIGGFLFLSNTPISRHQGVFFHNNFELFKVIENIKPLDCEGVEQVINEFYLVRRVRSCNTQEEFYFPYGTNSLIYSLSGRKEVLLDLDCRKAYDNRQFGRYYYIYEKEGKIIIEFVKRTDSREDSTHEQEEYRLFMVINKCGYKKIEKFAEKEYTYDRRRNEPPFSRYTYEAVVLDTEKAIISFSDNLSKAIEENNYLVENEKKLFEHQKMFFNGFKKRINDKAVCMAYKASTHAVISLTNTINEKKGIYAGLPWFFQFWTRDEAVSLKALMMQNRFDSVKQIIMRQLPNIMNDGKLPNRFPPSELGTADGTGWYWKRVVEFIDMLDEHNILLYVFNKEEMQLLKDKLEKTVYALVKYHSMNEVPINGPLETWMDTENKGDVREGVRIEIVALRLSLYNCWKRMCELVGDRTGYKMASQLEGRLHSEARRLFWNRKYLKDGSNDDTIRPNIFIACYAYPDLLSKKEWITCFKHVLPALWLEWGGLSTIDKSDPLFTEIHTGPDNRSYHRGDSWYWLNNLAALCMARVSKAKFRRYIQKIVDASTRDILWLGAMGFHSEISSARIQEPMGCFAQAWSSAMYIELIDEYS